MDLKHLTATPSLEEQAAVDAVIGPDERGDRDGSLQRAARLRTLLLPGLHALQDATGWVSPGGLAYLCRRLEVPPAEAWGVASFYSALSLSSPRPRRVHVCDDIACRQRGSRQLLADVQRAAGDGVHVEAGPCLGLCEQAPAALVSLSGKAPRSHGLGRATPASVTAALEQAPADERAAVPPGGPLRMLARVGVVDADSLDDYRAHGGYEALRIAIEMGPARVIREVTEAGLLGRGGAAFPVGKKWAAVASQPVRPHYLVCNADESEPGTFKDRVLLEHDPFAVVEAMTIAGLSTGAERGFIYLRAEYPLAERRLRGAIEQARARGLLGERVMGRGAAFDIELRRGAGAYICGEETALFRSIEGQRGEPSSKPPFPVEAGLFKKPTAINNVETLVATLFIVQHGAQAYRSVGTAGSPGTKLFCVSGHVARGGVYEVPFGTTLGALLDMAGGPPEGELGAVLLGGAAGTFVGPGARAMPLTFEDARREGATLGSGVVLALDRSVDLLGVARSIAGFFRHESCGQCVPCRVGTVRQDELLARLAEGAPRGSVEAEIALLGELSQAMRDASICGLGQTATSAVMSLLPHLPVIGERGLR